MTAAGRPFSYKYGYGSINGVDFVKAAQSWELVKPQAWVDLPVIQLKDGAMDIFHAASGGEDIVTGGVSSKIQVTKDMLDSNNFEKLEHITIKVWITHSRRGDVEVELVSPHGVKSILAAKRYQDAANTGFPGWTFMTVKHWYVRTIFLWQWDAKSKNLCRDEDPIGDWTIRVSDQNKEDEGGKFLGWTMTLWGSVADASKAKQWEVPLIDDTLPPTPNPETPSTPTATSKTHTKPTAHLPGDHGSSEGEAHKPAFPGSSSTSVGQAKPTDASEAIESPPSSSSTPTPDEGWFAELGNLVSNQVWFFVALGAVAIFGAGVGIFFWRRAVRRRKNYSTLPGDELAMGSMGGRRGTRTKELYDAFGEASDDEDADEETGLRPGRMEERSPNVGLTYHSGFLDDDAPSTAGGPPTSRYKDEPDQPPREPHPVVERSHSPDRDSHGSGSGDGSWEHASETR